MAKPSNEGWDRGETLDAAFLAEELQVKADLVTGDMRRWRRNPSAPLVFDEPLTGYPERLFVVRFADGQLYGGYKTISDLVVNNDLPGVFCSRIQWHNVLGPLQSFRVSDADARLVVDTVSMRERRTVFDAIGPDSEIVHPFPKYARPGHEKTTRSGGWLVSDERAKFLGLGEAHLRAYTHELLGPRLAALGEDLTAYDPACSTGQFLAEFASTAPIRVRTVGQDLSSHMVDYARRRLDRVEVGDAIRPVVPRASVDLLFNRFLNSEVVSTEKARRLLPGLVATLRPGGLMVLLGHSPVLVDRADLVAAGLEVQQSTGRRGEDVFQYHLCRRADPADGPRRRKIGTT